MQNEIYFDNDQEDIPRTVRRRKKQLYDSIRERMEFYFSDANLQKDRYLSKLLHEDPQVDLSTFLRFNRIHQLTQNLNDLKKALKKSEFLELSEDKSKVYRKTPVKEKSNVDACTIYVEQLSWDVDHDWLKQIFSRYGKVDYVSIPKYKQTGKIKGFAFVEFETPEAARAALDEFEKEGCCITNSLNPEKLCSIATFEDDKHEAKNAVLQQDANRGNKYQKKRTVDESGTKVVGGKRKLEDEGEEEFESDEKRFRKCESAERSESRKDQEDENGRVEDNGGAEGVIRDTKNDSHDENNVVTTEVEIPTKKKKNRKKKKSLKTKPVKDVKMYGLQILSKGDWKRLRNKYLNIQKEKMKKLKHHLYKNQLNHSHRQQQPVVQFMDTPTKPRFAFTKGVVVKITLNETFKDGNQTNQFKCDAKSLSKVEYVDVEVGSATAYVRFAEASAAEEAVQRKAWEKATILEGEEEEKYWEKMKRDRSEKFESRKKFKKKRGRTKILDKTEKLMSKRIRLSVDE